MNTTNIRTTKNIRNRTTITAFHLSSHNDLAPSFVNLEKVSVLSISEYFSKRDKLIVASRGFCRGSRIFN